MPNRILLLSLIVAILTACSSEDPEQRRIAEQQRIEEQRQQAELARQERERQLEERRIRLEALRATPQSRIAITFAGANSSLEAATRELERSGNRLRFNTQRSEIRDRRNASLRAIFNENPQFQEWEGQVREISVGLIYLRVLIEVSDPARESQPFIVSNPGGLSGLDSVWLPGSGGAQSGLIPLAEQSDLRAAIERLNVGDRVRISGQFLGHGGDINQTGVVMVSFTDIQRAR